MKCSFIHQPAICSVTLVNLILKLTLNEIKTFKILDQVGWPDQGRRGI